MFADLQKTIGELREAQKSTPHELDPAIVDKAISERLAAMEAAKPPVDNPAKAEADAAQRDSRDAELLAEVEIGDGGLQTLDAVDARLREVIAG